MGNGWIGVDLDGTLAKYDGWKGSDHIGEVIPKTLKYIQTALSEGIQIRIFTARASCPEQIPVVKRWLKSHGLGMLGVTCKKDFQMISLRDDRCVQVIPNTGITLEEKIAKLEEKNTYWSLQQFNEEGKNQVLTERIAELERCCTKADQRIADLDRLFSQSHTKVKELRKQLEQYTDRMQNDIDCVVQRREGVGF